MEGNYDKIWEKAKQCGLHFDEQGYVAKAEDNLVMPFDNWQEIKGELQQGDGGELKIGDGTSKTKFCAVHSSAALCVNNFALLKKHVREINFIGLGKFDSAVFEGKLSTGLHNANLDVILENEDTICGVESKFTEILKAALPDHDANLTNYKNRIKEITLLPEPFAADILDFYIGKKEMLYLDAAQLIKHTIALVRAGKERGKKPILVYIYWKPNEDISYDSIFAVHEAQAEEFAQRASKYIDFKPVTYSAFWDFYKENALMQESVKKNKARYAM